MSWLLISLGFFAVCYIICKYVDAKSRKTYVPIEEKMQRYAQPDKYVPWSYSKRMRYYDREISRNRKCLPSRPTYRSTVETGYVHNDNHRRY